MSRKLPFTLRAFKKLFFRIQWNRNIDNTEGPFLSNSSCFTSDQLSSLAHVLLLSVSSIRNIDCNLNNNLVVFRDQTRDIGRNDSAYHQTHASCIDITHLYFVQQEGIQCPHDRWNQTKGIRREKKISSTLPPCVYMMEKPTPKNESFSSRPSKSQSEHCK